MIDDLIASAAGFKEMEQKEKERTQERPLGKPDISGLTSGVFRFPKEGQIARLACEPGS